MDCQAKAVELKALLLKIYRCTKDFELLVIDKKRIRIYSKWICVTPLEEIAIHEYAHHIHETEKRENPNRRQERVHGPEFWRIYSALCCKATLIGLYSDDYVADIVLSGSLYC